MTIHRADDGKEMEALSVGQKRARTPSPHSSSRSLSRERNDKKDNRIAERPLSKKSTSSVVIDKEKNKDSLTSKISLSRTLIPKPQREIKKAPKTK